MKFLTTKGIVNSAGDGDSLNGDRIKEVKALIEKERFKIADSKRMYKKSSSYGMKEFFERKYKLYIANGTFIQAMVDLGFDFQQTQSNSPNAFFNIDPKEPNRLSKEYYSTNGFIKLDVVKVSSNDKGGLF